MTDLAHIETAIERCVSEFGLDIIDDRERVVAIVADLVGVAGGSSADQIVGLRAGLAHVDREPTSSLASLRLAIADSGLEATPSAGLAALVHDRAGRTGTPALERWRLFVGAGIAATAVVVGLIVFRPDPDPQEQVTAPTPTVEFAPTATAAPLPSATPTPAIDGQPTPTLSTPTPLVATEVGGFRAEYAPVTEGPFEIERQWVVDRESSEFVGTLRLTNRAASTVIANHRELPPPAAIASDIGLRWMPDPTNQVQTTGIFAIELGPGEQSEISYRAPIDDSLDLTSDLILTWHASWAPSQAELNSLLSEKPDLAAPAITDF